MNIGPETGFRSILTDVTGRKRVEDALKESEDRFRTLADNVPQLEWMADATGFIFWYNKQWYDYTGTTPEQMEGWGWQSVHDPEVLPKVLEQWKASIATGQPFDMVFPLRRADGDFRPFLTRVLPVMDDHGNVVRWFGTNTDITNELATKRIIEDERARLQAVLDTLPTGVVIADASGKMIEMNDATKQIWGMDAPLVDSVDQYVEYKGWHLDTGERYKAEDWALARALTKGETIVGEVIDIERFDGERATILNSAAPIKNQIGKIIGGVVTVQDVTEIRRAEENLRRSNEELQQFAYVASHDLQEPLRMVISYLTMLERRQKDKLDADAQEYIQYAVEGGKRMKELIDDLLAYSRVDTAANAFQTVEMNDLVERTLQLLKVPIEESGAIISVDILPSIDADESQIIQVVQNLIGNAIKFHGTERPRVRISAMSGPREWIFSVSDNGIGLNTEYSDRIFQMFQRLHTKEQYQGTGVGLAIAKRIIDRHGGRIWVESEEGEGATFFFTIPKAAIK